MPPVLYDKIYYGIVAFANCRIFDMYLCRIFAFAALVSLLYLSRLMSSFYIKVFAVIVALILYFLPQLVEKLVVI